MAIVQLKSTNPKFSFIIRKNPASGMSVRSIRKGFGYGWYSSEEKYNVYFKDAENDVSYKQHKDEKFEYLNVTRFTSPFAILNIINEFFDATLKKRGEDDVADQFLNEFSILLVNIENPKYIRFFQENFSDFELTAEEKAFKTYFVKVSTSKSIHELLNYVSLFCLFLAFFSEEYLDIDDPLLKKYLTVINTLDAPFYIRYLFGRNFLDTRERFNKFKKELESTSRYTIDFQFGNTAIQRRDQIKKLLAFDKPILDIGCGEGFYAIPFAKSIESHPYYAVDIDEELLRIVDKKAEKAELDNVFTFNSIDAFLENYDGEKVDVILTEVVEHMSIPEATTLIQAVLKNVNFDQFIVTTPNREFNRFYELDGFRHEDHKWEMTTDEFQAWVREICGEGHEVSFFNIGDSVDGVYTTQGALIKKKELVSDVA